MKGNAYMFQIFCKEKSKIEWDEEKASMQEHYFCCHQDGCQWTVRKWDVEYKFTVTIIESQNLNIASQKDY